MKMKRIEFITVNGYPVSLRVKDISVIMAKHKSSGTAIYVTGNSVPFCVGVAYRKVMEIIEEVEVC